MKYHHLGIPTTTRRPGETYLEAYKTFCTDHENNPFGIQWMRFEADCPFPEVVTGHEVLIEPNSPSEGVTVAFILCDGAPVEFLEFSRE
jgi:hypothetical protein